MMKQKQIILAAGLGVLMMVLGACKKDNSNSSPIIGTWEIRSSQTSIIPPVQFAAGNDSLRKFTNTNYFVYSKGQVAKSGTYSLLTDSLTNEAQTVSGRFTRRIIYDGNSDTVKTYLYVSGNTLDISFGPREIDGGTEITYERQ